MSGKPALCVSAQGQSDGSGLVVAMYNISAFQGSQAVLQCHSQRMVWTQDRLKDRQRVVHWDLLRSGPDHAMERVIDMFSAGDQRIYNGYNQGRINMPKTAFKDGNFSLVIKGEILFGNTKATAWNSIEIFTLQKISDVAFLDK